jgi:YfiH family protein
MSLLTTRQFCNNFFLGSVIAFISDVSVDFKLQPNQTQLTNTQKEYLDKELQVSLPEVININQVHGKAIVVIKDGVPQKYEMQDADGIITNSLNLPIAIRTADCVPIFMFDPVQKVIGVIHAGWQSTRKAIALEAANIFKKQFGSSTEDIKVVLGPSISRQACEVGAEFKEYFDQELFAIDEKLYLDVALANINQLLGAGLAHENIYNCGECTFSSEEYFSFRRQKDASGRMLHLMMLKG